MPLFQIANAKLTPVSQANFLLEKELQRLIEANLDPVFRCRVVASEFSTGAQHAGRIDTLALSEDNNPVIIEYKKVESSELINQSLYYLSWIHDHKGDFQVAAQEAFGKLVLVDWSDVRVICIAPNYKKYDLHAVQVMGANIELWTYRLFANSCIYLEEVLQKSVPITAETIVGKNPVMVEAGKKAALSRLTGSYTFEQHLAKKPEHIQDLARSVQDYMRALDAAVEEAPKKFYVAYRTSQNIVCMEIQKQKVLLYLKLDPKKDLGPPSISRDVSTLDTSERETSKSRSRPRRISRLPSRTSKRPIGESAAERSHSGSGTDLSLRRQQSSPQSLVAANREGEWSLGCGLPWTKRMRR